MAQSEKSSKLLPVIRRRTESAVLATDTGALRTLRSSEWWTQVTRFGKQSLGGLVRQPSHRNDGVVARRICAHLIEVEDKPGETRSDVPDLVQESIERG